MSRRYPDEPYEEAVDRLYDEAEQRDIDESALQDAHIEGQRAGLMGLGAGLNPWADPYSAEYKRWEAGRAAGEAMRLERLQRRKVA